MTGGNVCARCGEPLALPVRFCPFCGARQDVEANLSPPEPTATLSPPQPRAISAETIDTGPGAWDAGLAADRAASVDAGGRHRLPATPLPAPSLAPEAPRRKLGTAPLGGAPLGTAPLGGASRDGRRGASPARTAAARRAGRNPGRRGAIRKLAAAGFVLFCAAVLWRQMVAVPHGTLVVHLDKPVTGSILVDGIESGAPDQAIDLSPGRHRIGLEAEGTDTPQRTVSVRAGQTARLTLFPVTRPATLSLESTPPGAAIVLDGRQIGRTPLHRAVTPGDHRIVASLSGYEPLSRRVSIVPGATASLSLPLQPVALRRIAIDAPPGRWSAPLLPGDGTRFTLLFQKAIRVRIAGRVLLLEPGAPVALGLADATGIAVTAVGDEAVPVRMLISPAATEGSP